MTEEICIGKNVTTKVHKASNSVSSRPYDIVLFDYYDIYKQQRKISKTVLENSPGKFL